MARARTTCAGLQRLRAAMETASRSEADDWYFTAPSRRSYFMQGVVFAGVMADAAMVDAVITLDHVCPRGRGGGHGAAAG